MTEKIDFNEILKKLEDQGLEVLDEVLSSLPELERSSLLQLLVTQKVRTKKDLQNWLKFFLDVDLADCIVSRYSNSCPLDFVWDVYYFCLSDTSKKPMSIFGIAGRASQKTLCASVLQAVLPLHFQRGVVHFGGTEDQANRAYTYLKSFVSRPYISPFLKEDPKISKTTFLVRGKEVEVEILALTESSVQGPHQPACSIDELASLAPNKLAAYPSIAGVPVYTQDGKPWVKFGISSRQGRYTVIETEFEKRHKTNAEFRFWTVLENTKMCPPEISGTEDLEMYVDPYQNKALLQSEFDQLDQNKQQKFTKVTAKSNCYSCPLAAQCSGNLTKQTSTCRSLKPVEATIEEFKQAELGWWLSQKMSLQPSADEMVFPKFIREEFEKTPREIYSIWAGKDPGKDLTVDELVSIFDSAGLKRGAGIDHGVSHPETCVIVYEDSQDRAYIVKVFAESGLEPPSVVERISYLGNRFKFSNIWPDPASPGLNMMLEKIFNVDSAFVKDVDMGIQLIKAKMFPTVGKTKIYGVKGECDALVDNIEKYRYKRDTSGKLTDTPVKADDDCIDALSYYAQNNWFYSHGIYAGLDGGALKSETTTEYQEKIVENKANWMKQEIDKAIADNGGPSSTGATKNKGFIFSF